MNTRTTLIALTASLLFSVTVRAENAKPALDEKDKRSYAVGMFYGKDWKRREIAAEELNLDKLFQGLKDGLTGNATQLTDAEMQEALNGYQAFLNNKIQEKRKMAAEKNIKEGEAFLAANKTKPGVVTTESGLQYKIITEGSGESPKREDMVVVKYRGTVVDGTEFDNSANAPGGTRSFAAGGVIPGWTEALLMMKPGAKWQLFIPSNLAYGEQARSAVITPNSTLIFDVELVSVQAAPPPQPAPAPLTSDIIKVPSLEEMKKGAKIETIKAEEVEKMQKQGEKK